MAGTIKALFKPQYDEVKAVQEVELTIEEGQIVGFLGPNGAGKTTTLKMMSGILVPTSGKVSVLGFNPWDRKADMLKQIALVMGNKNQLWWDLPAWDSFMVLKELYEVDDATFRKRIDRLVDVLDLSAKVQTQVRKMSLGERMKCELVAALLHGPRVVFLDEPTIGLDVVSQKRIRDFLSDLHKEEGCTIILTSHYMQDVRELCERVVIIDHGQKIFDDSLEALTGKFGEERTVSLVLDKELPQEAFSKYGRVLSVEGQSVELVVEKEDTAASMTALLADLPVLDIQINEASIDDVIRRLFEESQAQVSKSV